MKSLLVIFFFSLIFASILITIHGSDTETSEEEEKERYDFAKLRYRLNKNGAKINGALRISSDSYLGMGGCGIVYKGIRINDSRPVAIKFIHESDAEFAEREYTIYSHLHAIDNAMVERFGIPAVYYYAKWEVFTVMAITLCEGDLNDRGDDFAIPINALIIFQQFVRQSKYLHSHGCRHDDIKPENILFRSYQSFLIDYNLASEMKYDTQLCTYAYKPRRCHDAENRKAIDDWESFFFGMCDLCGVPLKWLSSDKYENLSDCDLDEKYGEAKKDVKDIINKIEGIKSVPLRNAFMAFAREIFSKNAKYYPNYDWMDQFIAAQIKNALKPNQTIFFTWLDEADIEDAFKHISSNPIPNTRTDITDPMLFNFVYPNVDVNHFNGTYGHH